MEAFLAEPTFHFELISEDTKTSKVKSLALKSEPRTFLDVKKAVEKGFSIPVCVQTLLHQSSKVGDGEYLSSYYVRSGDTFQVIYPVEGDCESVLQVVDWLRRLDDAIASHTLVSRSTPEGVLFQLDEVGYATCFRLMSGQYVEMASDLTQNLIFPWTNRTKYVNKLHMDSLGVVELVMKAYQTAIYARLSNSTSLHRWNFMEIVCGLFVANFTQTFPLRRRIVEHGGLDHVLSTFVRSKDLFDSSDAIEVSLYALCK